MSSQTCGRRMLDWGPWERKAGVDHWRKRGGVRTCSFCGSIHQDDFFAAVEEGAEIGPTDKSYKVYVRDAGGKFYFQHLDNAGRARFIELHNAGRITYGYPGHLYVRPYFARAVPADPEADA